MYASFASSVSRWLNHLGMSQALANKFGDVSDFIMVLACSVLIYYLAKWVITRIIRRVAMRTSNLWDDALLKYKVFQRSAFLLPGIIVYQSIPITLSEFPKVFCDSILKLTNIYIVIVFILVTISFLNALFSLYNESGQSKFQPVKGYLQIGKIIVYVVGILLILSYLFNQSPLVMLTGLGAFSAILLLIFKDPILGLVGGVQLSANDMLRIGDWISMPKFGADGTVQEISLTTVKVQNFDNTITTLPTYSLVSESFQNYRGMKESGVRRLKRSISIDMSSVKFCTNEMLDKFRNIEILTEYLEKTSQELEDYNRENNIDNTVFVNGRRQTNIGVFRAYLEEYLQRHPMVHQDSDLLVRQLQPTSSGIPIEIYAFTIETEFIKYEKVQSDIFDHILAIVPHFELSIFQSPTGEDMRINR